jgi:uncharacterized protein YggE
VSISETGGAFPPPMPMVAQAGVRGGRADTEIDPGEQVVSVSLAVSFELE